MMYFWWLVIVVGSALQLLVIRALLRGWHREFRVLFVYVVVLFLSTVLNAAAYYSPATQVRASRYYWLADAVLQTLIFLLVLSFTHSALGQRANKAAVRRMLWAGAGVFVLVV